MKNKLILGLLCCMLCSPVFSQKFVIGYGLSLLSDAAILRSSNSQKTYPGIAPSLGSVALEMQYNLVEFNTDLSLSANASPGLGSMVYEGGPNSDLIAGNFRIPLVLRLNYGNLATFETMKRSGTYIGMGLEYNKIGLVSNLFEEHESSIDGFISPTIQIGFRYMNYQNSAREYSIRYTLPRNVNYNYVSSNSAIEGNQIDVNKIRIITISYVAYFNY